ncbi:MAG: hypothetical protein AAGA33_14055 [Pseudomonadota bacterium]
MERLAQYWDDLDDLFWSFAASGERFRVVLFAVAGALVIAAAAATGIAIGLAKPFLALGAASLMIVLLMTRAIATQSLNYEI